MGERGREDSYVDGQRGIVRLQFVEQVDTLFVRTPCSCQAGGALPSQPSMHVHVLRKGRDVYTPIVCVIVSHPSHKTLGRVNRASGSVPSYGEPVAVRPMETLSKESVVFQHHFLTPRSP